MEPEKVDLPPPSSLPGTNILFPYVFVADEAFPLKKYLLRPFPKKNDRMPDNERIFNYRLSRARRVIENIFGIMAARWQILRSCISCSAENAEQVVKALVCLHNFLMTCSRAEYCPPRLVDTERNGEIETWTWREQASETLFHRLGRVGANRGTRIANSIRNYLKQYFVSEIGQEQASWQNERVFRGHLVNLP